ncbi:MAG: hypothetical protein JXK95_09225 [Bacteroidales bacterium]|nr:hypothetical protein [Bacteroidales bacterium]
MVKILLPLVNIIVILVLQIFPGSVSVNLQAPAEVTAGTEFEVQITLNKVDLEGFSRFQQNIPPGLEALSANSANADFTFSENRLRLIWLRMPQQDEVTVTYKIKVDPRLKGTFDLGGKFSYIDNNERKSVDATPQYITILPSPDVDPSLIVDISEFEKRYIPRVTPASEEAANIACIRQKPYPGTAGNEYIVNVLVNKEDKKRFAKVEETVPEGYTAVALETRDAIFTFKNQTAKFLWMNLPNDRYFNVSYRLIPKNQAELDPPRLKGTFSYMVEDKTISIGIVERDQNLMALSDAEISNLVTDAINHPDDYAVSEPEPLLAVTETKVEETPVQEPVKVEEKPKTPKTSLSYTLEPESGVYYRVQIAAGHKAVNVERYFRKFNLDKEVRKELHQGWHKYSIGSFDIYREARDYRVHIWNTTPIKDAFVSAYNSGTRITVQEALMITEQRWYR